MSDATMWQIVIAAAGVVATGLGALFAGLSGRRARRQAEEAGRQAQEANAAREKAAEAQAQAAEEARRAADAAERLAAVHERSEAARAPRPHFRAACVWADTQRGWALQITVANLGTEALTLRYWRVSADQGKPTVIDVMPDKAYLEPGASETFDPIIFPDFDSMPEAVLEDADGNTIDVPEAKLEHARATARSRIGLHR